MNKNWNIFAYIGVGLSLVLSITAICLASPRTIQTSFDYQGVIVGTLSVLVTILIGWQIYNIINIQSSLDKFAHKMSKIDEIEKRYHEMSTYIDGQVYELAGHAMYIQCRYVESLLSSFEALCKYSQVESYKDSSKCINNCLCNLATVLQNIQLSKGSIDEIKVFNDVVDRLRSNPPRFSSPKTNESLQRLFLFISQRQKNIYNELSKDQWSELATFIQEMDNGRN